MAKISLRSYIHEIEGMMDKGQIEEVEAHCRYILQSFPKLLAAYRLLGKALLENRQYADAADIFQRVLSSTPDDFVSQVGMSIIREDEGNLDAAIWHMERAFEIQPYNVAIQDELRRLYGRRDGIQPPKVRLTRGALARMYAKGNLYQQAIAELRAGLMEDPTRVDLQIVLARMYFQSRQGVEAVDTCSALIKKFPYCLEANRILSNILPDTGRKEDTQMYSQRVQALDPYLVHADPEATTSEAVPENIVMLERLEYQKSETSAETPSLPAWAASLGVKVDEISPKKEEEVPAWLASIQQKVAEDARKTEPSQQAEIAAEPSSSPSPFVFDESSVTEPDQPAAAVPTSAGQSAFTDQPEASKEPVEAEQPGGLDQTGVPGLPEWLSGVEETSQPAGSQSPDELIPDWMKAAGWVPGSGGAQGEPLGNTFDAAQPPDQTGDQIAKADVPDWLKAIAPEGALEEEPSSQTVISKENEPIPSAETRSPVEAELPDWLNEISPTEPSEKPTVQPVEPAPASSEAELPGWLQEIGEEAKPAAETGAPIEEKATIWEEEKPVEIPVSAPLEESVPGVNLEDQDAALAWLESLAAKQGVSEEELITRPEERQETPPSWLHEAIPGEPKEETPVPTELETPAETVISQEVVETPVPVEPAVTEIQAKAAAETPAPQDAVEIPVPVEPAVTEIQAEAPAEAPVPQEAVEIPVTVEPAVTEIQAEAPVEVPAPQEAVEIPVTVEPAVTEIQAEALAEAPVPQEAAEIPVTIEPAVSEIQAEAPAEIPAPQEVAETPTLVEPVAPEIQAEAPAEAEGAELPEWLKEIPAETVAAVPGEEEAGEAEKPAEPAELPEWLLAMETEAPPSAPLEESVPGVNISDQDAAMAWLESLAAKQGAAEEELTTRPEERLEAPPSWVQELSEEGLPAKQEIEAEAPAEAMPEAPVEIPAPAEAGIEPTPEISAAPEEAEVSEEKEIQPEAVSGVELPGWLQEMALEEAPAAPPTEAVPEGQPEEMGLPDWLQEISLEETPPTQVEQETQAKIEVPSEAVVEPVLPQPAESEAQPPAVPSDEEAAMAWLESLAAKQGVPEEELTTRPEERPEAPPAWVQEEVIAEQAKEEQPAVVEQPPAEVSVSPVPAETLGEAVVEEQPAPERGVEEQPVGEEPSIVMAEAAQPAEEVEQPAWLEEMASTEEFPVPQEEIQAEEEQAVAPVEKPAAEPVEAVPPLPAWLEHAGEEETIELPEIAAAPQVNVNTASLVELENLPGLGFILAQALVNHREKHGPFASVDDLADVDGFNPGIVAEIRERVTTVQPMVQGVQPAPEAKELESIEGYEADLLKARNAMVAGDVESTLIHYEHLIDKDQMLNEVIRDLHETLYRYPVDANIWTALGDAYMHNNQLQEALDAYVKAEELIR